MFREERTRQQAGIIVFESSIIFVGEWKVRRGPRFITARSPIFSIVSVPISIIILKYAKEIEKRDATQVVLDRKFWRFR